MRRIAFRLLTESGVTRARARSEHGSVVWRETAYEEVEICPIRSNAYVADGIRAMAGCHRIPGMTIEEVEDVSVHYGIPFDGMGRLIQSAIIPENYRDVSLHIPVRALMMGRTQVKGTSLCSAVTLANAWVNSYFHWVTEMLPRVALLLEAKVPFSAVVMRDKPNRWQEEGLSLMGIDVKRQVLHDRHLSVKRLLLPSFSRRLVENGRFSVPSPSALHVMRNRLGWNAPRGEGAILWITRRKAAGRHVVNEDEVLAELEGLGVQMVVLEDLRFSEQMDLFRHARMVIGPHGAGLANIVFCREGTKVVEVVGEFVNASFLTLAASLHLVYFLYQGKPIRRFPKSRSDIFVNAAEFAGFIREQVLAGGPEGLVGEG